MFRSGARSNQSAGNSSDLLGHAYVGYDCLNNTFCVAASLLDIPVNDNCAVQEIQEESFVKFANMNGENPPTKTLHNSTPGVLGFEYVRYGTSARTIGK